MTFPVGCFLSSDNAHCHCGICLLCVFSRTLMPVLMSMATMWIPCLDMMQATRTSKKAIYLDLRRGGNAIIKAGLNLGCGLQISQSDGLVCIRWWFLPDALCWYLHVLTLLWVFSVFDLDICGCIVVAVMGRLDVSMCVPVGIKTGHWLVYLGTCLMPVWLCEWYFYVHGAGAAQVPWQWLSLCS